jgi:hypothetical protein
MARRKLLGEVNLLGLQAFGGDVSPLVGTLIGGGVAGITSMTLGHVKGGAMSGRRELYGFLAGAGAAGVMLAMPSTKKAAFGALIGAFLASGLSLIEKHLLGTIAMPAAAAQAVAGMGMAKVNYLNGRGGLGMAKVNYLNGLGIPSIAPVPQSVGTIPGVAGPAFAGTQLGQSVPVSLLGQASSRSNQVSLMGGPQIHGLSAAYGATLLGSGR